MLADSSAKFSRPLTHFINNCDSSNVNFSKLNKKYSIICWCRKSSLAAKECGRPEITSQAEGLVVR
jgi:hypothetical protein